MNTADLVKTLNDATALGARVRASYAGITQAVASLETALAAGVGLPQEVVDAANALVAEGKLTLSMLEIMGTDQTALSGVTEALVKGAKAKGDLSA